MPPRHADKSYAFMSTYKANGISKERRPFAMLILLAAGLCAVAMGSFARAATAYVPTTEVVLFRSILTIPILGVILLRRGTPLLGNRPDLIFVRSITGFLALCLGFYALTRVPFVCVSVLSKTSVIFTALLGVAMLRERITVAFMAWIAVAFVGASFVLQPQGDVFNLGGAAILASGLAVALTSISTRKLQQTESSVTIVFGFALWSCIFAYLCFGRDFVWPSAEAYGPLLGMGLCGLAGQLMFTTAFKFAPASFVQHEPPTGAEVIGGVLIVVAGIGLIYERSGGIGDALLDKFLTTVRGWLKPEIEACSGEETAP
jgi:drug/metabolite transporter (DMT)-like permease